MSVTLTFWSKLSEARRSVRVKADTVLYSYYLLVPLNSYNNQVELTAGASVELKAQNVCKYVLAITCVGIIVVHDITEFGPKIVFTLSVYKNLREPIVTVIFYRKCYIKTAISKHEGAR